MPTPDTPSVLVLTPMKDTARHLDRYVRLLEALDWPRDRLSLGVLEGDSTDGTFPALEAMRSRLERRVHRLVLAQKHYRFHMPAGTPRWAPAFQLTRRAILARVRNQLLFRALDDEDYVLWIDADLESYPPDVLRRLLGQGVDVAMPHCTLPNGHTFDLNAWSDAGRQGFQTAKDDAPIRLDAVGGTMLLVKADCHREGLIFPAFPYGVESPRARPKHPVWRRGEIETEGLGIMAADMGIQCWGFPAIRIVHSDS
jgi:peptide chain release factor subunit 1